MKIIIDDQLVLELEDYEAKIIEERIGSIADAVKNMLVSNCEVGMRDYRRKWEPELQKNGVEMVPLDEKEFCKLVDAQPKPGERENEFLP